MKFESTKESNSELFLDEIDEYVETKSSNDTPSNTNAYWDKVKQKLNDDSTVADTDKTAVPANAAKKFINTELPNNAPPAGEKGVEVSAPVVGGAFRQPFQLHMLPGLQLAGAAAIADLQTNPAIGSPALQGAVRQAAQMGKLPEFIEALNNGLKNAGITNIEVQDAPPGVVPGGGGKNFPKAFVLKDTRTGQVIETIGPVGLPGMMGLPGAAVPPVEVKPTYKELLDRLGKQKDEAKNGNKASAELVKQTEAQLMVAELESGPAPHKAGSIVKNLSARSVEGDAYARATLLALLVSSADKVKPWEQLNRFSDNIFASGKMPDLSKQPSEFQEAVQLEAIKGLRESMKRDGLSSEETSAMALVLKDYFDRGAGDGAIPQTIRAAFYDTYNQKDPERRDFNVEKKNAVRTEKMMEGLFSVLSNTNDAKSSGTQALVYEYAKVAGGETNKFVFDSTNQGKIRIGDVGRGFVTQVEKWQEQALKGDKVAIEVLAAFAGGIGKFNHLANPGVRTKESPYTDVPGGHLALTAGDTLYKAANTNPETRKIVIDSLMSELQIKKLPDGSAKLATLGRVAALNPNDISDEVRTLLRAGLADKHTHESAARGMMALAKNLDNKDLETISKNLSPYMIEQLQSNAFKMPAEKGAQLANMFAEKIVLRYTPEQRLEAIQALVAIGPQHATESSIMALRRLGGKAGKEFIDEQLKKDPWFEKDHELRGTKVEAMQKQAGLGLLAIAERTADQDLKTNAFNAFANHDWGHESKVALQREFWSEFQGRLAKLARDNPKNVAIQVGVPKLSYNLERQNLDSPRRPDEPPRSGNPINTRLAASFRDRGGLMSDDALSLFTEIAIARHGVSTVEKVSDRIALFNALTPDVRKQLTGFSGTLEEGKNLDLTGKSISSATFNKLPANVRKDLSGKEELMPAATSLGAEQLKGKAISGATFNSFSPELRKELSGSEQTLATPQSISLLGRNVDATTFNKLPAELRKQMFGTEDLIPEPGTLKIDRAIFGADWNKLPPKMREFLSPDGKSDLAATVTQKFEIKNKVIDAKTFNQLTYEQRKILGGSVAGLAELNGVPDLSRVRIPAEQFNKLSADEMKALGQTVMKMPAGSFVSLQGQKIDAELFNQLPSEVRKTISGSEEHLPAGRVIRDLSSFVLDAPTFNALSREQRTSLTATSERLAPSIVLGQLANGTIGDASSLANVLLGPASLEQSVSDLTTRAKADLKKADEEVNALISVREKIAKQLLEHSIEGVGFFSKLGASLLDDLGEGQRRFIRTQDSKIFDLKSLDQAIQDFGLDAQMAKVRVQTLEIAKANQEFSRLMRQGHTESADQLALMTYGTYGRAVFAMAPDMNRSLRMQGEGVNSGTVGRLFKSGQSQFPVLQINEKAGAAEGVETGIAMLSSIKPKFAGDKTKATVMFSDAPEIRKEALQGIDRDPTVQKLNALSQTVSEQLGTLNSQITAMQKRGDKFQDFIDDSNRRANIVKEALNGLTEEDRKRLNSVRDSLSKALKDDSIADPEAKIQLKQRFDALDKALMLFDPDYDKSVHQKEKIEKRDRLANELEKIRKSDWAKTTPPNDNLYATLREKGYDVTSLNHRYWKTTQDRVLKELQQTNSELNQRANVEKMVNFLSSPEAKKESTFRTWWETDGVELLGAAIGAVIITALVVASFGTAVPLLILAAAGTLGFMAGREITKEIQRGYDVRTDGSLLGDYSRGRTITGEDGIDRPMSFWSDVAAPLATEFAIGTAIGWAGGGLGNYIGQGLRSSIRSILVAENKQALAQLTQNIRQLEANALKKPFFARFAQEVFKQSTVQLAVLPAFMAADAGAQQSLKNLGAAVNEGNMLTSFLAAVAVSIPFGAMKGSVRPKGKIASHGEILPVEGLKPGEPHLRLVHEGTPEAVDSYIQSAQKRGAQIEVKGNGRFIEITKEGLIVEWTGVADAAPVASSKPVDVPAKQAASLPDRSAARVEIDVPKADPAQAQRLKAEMDALLKPAMEKEAAIAKLESSYRPFEAETIKQIEKLPSTAEGERQFNELNRQLKERKLEFEQQKQLLQSDADALRKQVSDSNHYQQLRLARSIAENNFPAGEYQLRINGQDGIKLSVGMETFSKDGTIHTRYTGEPVPVEHVNQLLKALEAAQIRPESVVINNKSFGAEGSIVQRGTTYEITINVGVGQQPVRLTFNHETGHLYDFRGFRHTAEPQAHQQVMEAYKTMLLKEGGPIDIIARKLGQEPTPQLREQIAKELCDPANQDFTADKTKTVEDRLKYLASRGEVFAEMFKLHQEKTRIIKEQGREPSYEELLQDYTGKYNPFRAEMMKSMGDVFTALEKNAFNVFKVSEKTPAAIQGRQASQSLPAQFKAKPPAEELAAAKPLLDEVKWEGTRRQRVRTDYERALSDGKLTAEQVKRILDGDKGLRDHVESVLGKFNAESLNQFMEWTPTQREQLIDMPLKMFEAVNNGMIDAVSVERVGKILFAEDTIPRPVRMNIQNKIIDMVDPKSGFTPEMIRNSVNLLESFAKVPEAGTYSLGQIFSKASVPRETVSELIADTVKSPTVEQFDRLSRLAKILETTNDIPLLKELVAIKDPGVNATVERALLNNRLTAVDDVKVYAELANRGSAMHSLANQVINDATTRNLNHGKVLRALSTAKMEPAEIIRIQESLSKHGLSAIDLTSLANSPAHVRQGVLDMMHDGTVSGATSVTNMIYETYLTAIVEARAAKLIDNKQLTELFRLSGDHGETHRMAVGRFLAEQMKRPAALRFEPAVINEVLTKPERAEHYDRLASDKPYREMYSAGKQILDSLGDAVKPGSAEKLETIAKSVDKVKFGRSFETQLKILGELSAGLSKSKLTPAAKSTIVDEVLTACESLNQASASIRIDAFLCSPKAQTNFAGMQSSLDMLQLGATVKPPTVNAPKTVTMLKMEGWSPKMEDGKPIIRDGKIVMENPGCMQLDVAHQAKVDQTVYTMTKADGKLTIKLRTPLELTAAPEDILVSDVSSRSVGNENCSNCVKALLQNLVNESGIVKLVADGKLQAPKPLSGMVRAWEQTGQPFSAQAVRECNISEIAKFEPGIYRGETLPAERTGGGGGAHTFVMVVPGEGAQAYFLCGTTGRRLPIDAYGSRVMLGRVYNDNNVPIPASRLSPIAKTGG